MEIDRKVLVLKKYYAVDISIPAFICQLKWLIVQILLLVPKHQKCITLGMFLQKGFETQDTGILVIIGHTNKISDCKR